eukprot:XP_025015852.1 uncharacterized protein LOC112537423 isoform X1 [Ricinus communis]
MSTKTNNKEIPNSKKLSTMTIHETFSPIYIKLDGSNYRVWSKILEMHIVGRKKKGYITGRKVIPTEDDPGYDEWEAEDALVKSWLINSMTDNLMSHFVQCETSKEVWDAAKRSYLDISDSSQVYELMKRSFQLRQGLDHSLDQVSSRVLATSPLPSLEEAYSLVRRECRDKSPWEQKIILRLQL